MPRIYSAFSAHCFALAKFGTVGAITAAIYFLVMWIANSGFGWHYVLSITLAYVVSTSFHYLANRHFTFGAGTDSHRQQLTRYMVMWCVNYLLTLLIVDICVKHFGLSPYMGVCASVVVTVITGYAFSRFWVFRIRG